MKWLLVLLVVGLWVSSSLDVHCTERLQQVYGSGAAFTPSSTYLFMSRLSTAERLSLFRMLFGPHDVYHGAQFNAMRIVMGTCDFSLTNYTYDELPSGVTADYNMSYFSISKDLEYVIPAILEALAVNPHIRIIASPWSAPAWMKEPPTLFGGNLSSRLEVRQSYAKYFRLYVEAYIQLGIPIFAVTVQNEPRFETGSYPSMGMTASDEIQMALLIAAEFSASDIINGSTKVLVYDHNWDDTAYPIEVLSDPSVNVSDIIIGSAFHCYAGNVTAQLTVHEALPHKRIFFTECCGGAWAPDFSSNLMWDTQNLVLGTLNGWAETVTKWNMALDESCGPHLPAACTNCWGLLTIAKNGSVTFHDDYYALAHLSMWLNPAGDNYRVTVSEPASATAIAVNASQLHPTYVVVVLNSNSFRNSYTVQFHTKKQDCVATLELPHESVATVRWRLSESAAEWVITSGNQHHLLQSQPDIPVVCVDR